MKKVFLSVLFTFTLGLFFLTGCTRNDAPTTQNTFTEQNISKTEPSLDADDDSPAMTDTITSKEQNDEMENHDTTTSDADKHLAAVIEYSQAFEAFFNKFKSLVLTDDKTQLAALFTYPMSINVNDNEVVCSDKNSFVQQYETLFTPTVKTAIQNQITEDLFQQYQGEIKVPSISYRGTEDQSKNYSGVRIGNGEIWLGIKGNQYVIVAIRTKS